MKEFIKINECDNVIIALRDYKKDEVIDLEDEKITLLEDINRGHKIAIKNINKGENIVKKFLKYTILGFCTVGLGIIFFREEIVNIIFGENYQEYADLIIPLIIWTIISIVNNFLGPQYLVASGNSRLYSLSLIHI